MYALSKSVQ